MAFQDMFNFLGSQPTEVGGENVPKQWTQQPKLNWPQQAAQYALLGQSLNQLFQPQARFEPIRDEYMRAYREKTLPGLLSNHVGNLGGGDFQRAVAQGDVDLASRLAALQSEFTQRQSEKGREFATNLLNVGLRPSQENVYSPIPTEEAKQYLMNQGNPNPSPQQIQEVLPKFQTQQSLGQSAGGFLQQLIPDLKQAYQQGGLPAVQRRINQQYQQATTGIKAPTQNPAEIANRNEYFTAYPQQQPKIEQSLINATPEQQSAADWVLNHHQGGKTELFDHVLRPSDWPFLQSLMQSEHPVLRRIMNSIPDTKALDDLKKVMKQAVDSGNIDIVKKYIRTKYRQAD